MYLQQQPSDSSAWSGASAKRKRESPSEDGSDQAHGTPLLTSGEDWTASHSKHRRLEVSGCHTSSQTEAPASPSDLCSLLVQGPEQPCSSESASRATVASTPLSPQLSFSTAGACLCCA